MTDEAQRKGSDEPPDWDLLPYRACEFFELESGFDRKALKRAYNKLLRRYKPERFPVEFQKLRAAFELLDDQLRYGTQSSVPDPEFQTGAFGGEQLAELLEYGSGVEETESCPDNTGEAGSILERLRTETPEGLYLALQQSPSHSRDYYRLAILADVVALPDTVPLPDTVSLPDTVTFVEWLCRGLAAHAGDPRLIRLLYAHLHSAAVQEEPKLLIKRLAQVLSPGDFEYITEKLWIKILEKDGFPVMRALLDEYWGSALGGHLAGRLALSMRLARRAVFVADAGWLEEQMSFLWEHSEGDINLDEDFMVLEFFQDYLREREHFLTDDPVRMDMDRQIRAICEMEETEADRLFLAWRIRHRSQTDHVLDSIPFTEQHCGAALRILCWYNAEVDERIGEESFTLSPKRRHKAVTEYFRRIDRLTDKSLVGWLMHMTSVTLIFGVPILLLVLITVGLNIALSGALFWVVLLLSIAASAAGFWFWFLQNVAFPMDAVVTKRCYRILWRAEALEFLNQFPISPDEFAEVVQDDKILSGFAFASDYLELTQRDPGLAIATLLLHRR